MIYVLGDGVRGACEGSENIERVRAVVGGEHIRHDHSRAHRPDFKERLAHFALQRFGEVFDPHFRALVDRVPRYRGHWVATGSL